MDYLSHFWPPLECDRHDSEHKQLSRFHQHFISHLNTNRPRGKTNKLVVKNFTRHQNKKEKKGTMFKTKKVNTLISKILVDLPFVRHGNLMPAVPL